MFFSLSKKTDRSKILINSQPVTEKTVTKYLGVMIDNKLNWKQHIQYIKMKLSRATGIISKLRYFAPKTILTSLYYSLIQSYINYNLLNWSSTSPTNLDSIRLSTKRAVRIITFANKYETSNPIFKDLKILPLNLQIMHKQAVFMWKLHYGYIPYPTSSLFKLNLRRYNHYKYDLPTPRLEIAKHNISYSCVKLWNTKIPDDLKKLTLQKIFANQYKKYLLDSLY